MGRAGRSTLLLHRVQGGGGAGGGGSLPPPSTQPHQAALLPLLHFSFVNARVFVWVQRRRRVFPYTFLLHLAFQESAALMTSFEFILKIFS